MQDSEIDCYKWARAGETLRSLKYPNDLEMFKSALDWLNKTNKNRVK